MEHCLGCVARLVRILLGPGSLADHKMVWGSSLVALGVFISPRADGLHCWPSADKVKKWLKAIDVALLRKHLAPGDASKMAGRLAWGGSHLFRQLGRAMLRPLFDLRANRCVGWNIDLERALHWWKQVLELGITESKEWVTSSEMPLHLFCDARGEPPHLAAVLYDGSDWTFAHMDPPADLMCMFQRRADNQIMGLELLAISLGMSVFEREMAGKCTVVHCDNTGAEVSGAHTVIFCHGVCVSVQVSLRNGKARSWDHAQLVHGQWLHAWRHRMRLFIV